MTADEYEVNSSPIIIVTTDILGIRRCDGQRLKGQLADMAPRQGDDSLYNMHILA